VNLTILSASLKVFITGNLNSSFS